MILGFINRTPWYLRMLGYKPFRRAEYRVSPSQPNEPSRFVGYFYQDAPAGASSSPA